MHYDKTYVNMDTPCRGPLAAILVEASAFWYSMLLSFEHVFHSCLPLTKLMSLPS